MSLENLDVKNIYVIGENLKSKIGQEFESQFSGQKLVSWLLDNDGQVYKYILIQFLLKPIYTCIRKAPLVKPFVSFLIDTKGFIIYKYVFKNPFQELFDTITLIAMLTAIWELFKSSYCLIYSEWFCDNGALFQTKRFAQRFHFTYNFISLIHIFWRT